MIGEKELYAAWDWLRKMRREWSGISRPLAQWRGEFSFVTMLPRLTPAEPSPLIVVSLSERWEAEAQRMGEGLWREDQARRFRIRYRTTTPTLADRLHYHVNGARCEIAFSLALCGNHKEKAMFKDPDVGDIYQVRGTDEYTNRLLIEDNDNPSHAYVLAYSKGPRKLIFLPGWMYGYECRQHEPYRISSEGTPSWRIASHELHSMLTMPDDDAKHGFSPIWKPAGWARLRRVKDEVSGTGT